MIFTTVFSAQTGWWHIWIAAYGLLTLRYLGFAGLAFAMVYGWRRRQWRHRRLGHQDPAQAQLQREIGYSMVSIGIFAGVGALVVMLHRAGHTRIYHDIGQYGWGWFGASIGVMVLIHDTWFYWIHRFMHLRWVFRHVHLIHHLSHNPSPWAAFAFHPVEALLEVGVLPVIVWLIPVHPVALFVFLGIMMGFNVMGHLGYELFPAGFLRTPLGHLTNTTTHHHLHHRFGKHNYGLYFNLWDQLMRTNHPQYKAHFERITGKTAENLPSDG
ncbi:MAG: sterol desaturase family protein [Bacteroidia bacterium]|nr:sterol desaturase family protein [Bacteroidia bacterium]